MMRALIVPLLAILLLGGCESDHDKLVHKLEQQVSLANKRDWRQGIPLDELAAAARICEEHSDVDGCALLSDRLKDLATTLASCRADSRSALCRGMVDLIGKHPISGSLSHAQASSLPSTPLYWSMPTAALEAQAGQYGYRRETLRWWWAAWGTTVSGISAVAAIMIIATIMRSAIRQAGEDRRGRQEADAENNARQRLLAEQRKIEAKERAQRAREAELTEEKANVAAKLAALRDADAAAKLAAEKEQVNQLLAIALHGVSAARLTGRTDGTSSR